MGQEDIIASQYEKSSSQRGLFEHLSHLQHLNTLNVLDALRQRQEKNLAPLKWGQLRQPTPTDWQEYFTDLGQRSLLFWDTLRQRGDNTQAHERAGYPLLLKFDHETLIAGSDLPRQLMPELLATVGAEGEFWREVQALLEVPLPGFSLTQPPSETVVIPQETPSEPFPLAVTLSPQTHHCPLPPS